MKPGRSHRLFVLTGLGFGSTRLNPSEIPNVVCTIEKPGVRIRPILLLEHAEQFQPWMWNGSRHGRVVLDISDPDTDVIRFVGAIEGLFAHLHQMRPEPFDVLEVSPRMIRNRIIRESEIARRALTRFNSGGGLWPETLKSKLHSFIMVADIELAWLFFLLPTVIRVPALYDACAFFQECAREYSFIGDSIRHTLVNPSETPKHEREHIALEGVVLSAFRCVEALVGEPGKPERLRKRLLDVGINPTELVGFGGTSKSALEDRLYWLRDLRDSTSAHGRRRRGARITYFEAMEAQHLADAILHKVLWHEADRFGRSGTDCEIEFLLNAMYWTIDNPRWAYKACEDLGGDSPIEAVRKLGGLRKLGSSIDTKVIF